MQTIPSNGAPIAPGTSSPTTAQVHHGQLQDYELLLSVLRGEVESLSRFSQTLLRPRSFSPLNLENETGQEALQQLLVDPDYVALCRKNNVSPHYLIVTLKEGAFVYETSDRESANKIELTLAGNENWQVLRTRIEKAATLLGGQIRYDRLISAPRLATFYGMAPWDPANTVTHQAAIDFLEEKIASYELGLEEDFNLLDLKPAQTVEVRQASSQGVLPVATQDELHEEFTTNTIRMTIQAFLPDGVTSPLTYLGNDILMSATPERVQARPTVFLQKILQSPEAEKLGDLLLAAMKWYGGKPGEQTSPHIRTKVVANALQIWFKSKAFESSDWIAGYDLQYRLNWGRSYKSIWESFEKDLLRTNRATSKKEAIVMARLFLCQFPAEFRIADIPIDLPFRGSVVWVNFVSGVNLINFTDPKALYRKTFQQLVDIPLKISKDAKKEQLHAVALARLLPTVEWAATQGLIPQKQREEYTQTETDLAISELDTYTKDLSDALSKLNEAKPSRLSIAKSVIDHDFPKISDKNSVIDSFWSDHELAEPVRYLNWAKKHSIIDVVADNNFDSKKTWAVFKKNSNTLIFYIWLDEDRKLHIGDTSSSKKYNTICNAKELFEQNFKSHITSLTAAYKTLIKSLLSSLAYSDRQALELGTLKIYTLRKETYKVESKQETPEKILPRRARNGLLLLTTYQGVTRTFELLPRAGVIRRIDNLDTALFGGRLKSETWHIGTNPYPVEVLRHKTLNFDWKAHSTGSKPLSAAHCEAIIEQLGSTFMPPVSTIENADGPALTINSKRVQEISHFIATELLFVDPKALHDAAYGETEFDRVEASQERFDNFAKILVPFWKSIEDINSDDTERKVNGAFGLSLDVTSFALPIGKLASGSIKLLGNANSLTIPARLTAFASLTKEVSILALAALNPLDLIGALLKALRYGGLKLVKFGIFRIKAIASKAGQYNFVNSLPQIDNAGRWKPLASGDALATVRGIDDVPVRKIANANPPHYRLIDPISGKPYGPSLAAHSDELALGRSAYRPLEKTDQHSIVEVAESAKVREVLEADGRTTLFIDDVAYQLDGDMLRRADKIDIGDRFKALPCRVRRAPGETCQTSFVTRTPAPVPAFGTFDETKGWALWFGDAIYTPAPGRARLKVNSFIGRANLNGRMEFRKGIYGRIEINVPSQQSNHTFQVGAIIADSMDGSKRYVFTRLNAGDFYVAELPIGQSLQEALTFKKASTLTKDLRDELQTVYTGSLNANNMARIYGVDRVERAIQTMESIAVPIGGHVNPPDTLKLLKVDTSPGEAVLFDHSTRMIVSNLPNGATSWSRSRNASQAFRQRTADIFDTLFVEKTINVRPDADLRINKTMDKFQKLLPRDFQSRSARNIAYADIVTSTGKREVYVSVSGAQGLTGELPLFKHPFAPDKVIVGDTTYFNIDLGQTFTRTSLNVSGEGKVLAIPHTIQDIDAYTPAMTSRPTSLDSEAKLISVLREKYPDNKMITSIDVATTMPPCNSCSVVIKEFGYDGGKNALNVLWH
ncbi:hypothetical protein EI534_00660 [Pseudomonas frederiksbergensis]|nr:hypothetical protein [Pseudomonas frederiksbergensis]